VRKIDLVVVSLLCVGGVFVALTKFVLGHKYLGAFGILGGLIYASTIRAGEENED